jgi:hypothetical protein
MRWWLFLIIIESSISAGLTNLKRTPLRYLTSPVPQVFAIWRNYLSERFPTPELDYFMVAIQHNLIERLDHTLADSYLLSKISDQWIRLSAHEKYRYLHLLRYTASRLGLRRALLLKLLSVGISDKLPTQQYFLLEMCAIFISELNWKIVSFGFLKDMLELYGHEIADYFPERVWLDLSLEQAEDLLSLENEDVSLHVRSLKFKFGKEPARFPLVRIDHLPWATHARFKYWGYSKDLLSHDFTFHNSKMKIEMKKVSQRLRCYLTLATNIIRIPDFSISLQRIGGGKLIRNELFFDSQRLKNIIKREKQANHSTVTVELRDFLPLASEFTPGREYLLTFQIMRLS